jgi:acetate kinase
MQVLQESTDPQAKEAIDLYCYRASRELASLVSTLDGIDAIIFTAGIGENSAHVRGHICERLKWLGVALDKDANQRSNTLISQAISSVKVLVIPTNEELIIAQSTRALVSALTFKSLS